MNKLKLFVENFFVYGFGGIISTVIPLVMIPIATRIMPNSSYFGISDLSNTVVQFGSAIAIMGMYDAMYRMFFEKEDVKYKKTVCSTALIFTFFTSVIVFLIMLLLKNAIAKYFFSNSQYAYVVYVSAMATLVGATNSIISAPTRMQNKRAIFLVTNTISPILSYLVAIPLLLDGHYVIALPLAGVISAFSMEIIFGLINRDWFSAKFFDVKMLKQLLIIAVPLLPNFIIYWVFDSCDKLMITNLIGLGAAGIYSIGSKLGSASQLIYVAFAGGWQYFAFLTMKEEKQVESNSLVFEYLGVISFVATSFVCAWSYGLFKFLFTDEYLDGYVVAPYLFFSPLLLMLFQVEASQFLVIKKTWPNMFILSSGALLNIIINLILIPVLGIEGASIATLVGYIVSDIVCTLVLVKMNLMILSKRFIVSIIILLFYFVMWRLFFSDNCIVGTFVATFVAVVMFLIYKDSIIKFLNSIKGQEKTTK